MPEERISQEVYSHCGPSEFLHATMASQLIDLPSVGSNFTWPNNSIGPYFSLSLIELSQIYNGLICGLILG